MLAGLGLGGWPEDYLASQVRQAGTAAWASSLSAMRRVWEGRLEGQGGPTPELPEGRPALLFGGLVPAAYRRAAVHGQGWVAPLFGLSVLQQGVAAVREAWARAGRPGAPRIATGRYFSLGKDADAVADDYVRHYYGDDYFAAARADTLTSAERLAAELAALEAAGATDVLLFPASGAPDQVGLLAEALGQAGFPPAGAGRTG